MELILVIWIVFTFIAVGYLALRLQMEKKANVVHRERAIREAQKELAEWKVEAEKRIRKDAITRSERVKRGQIAEHFIPFWDDFPYDPKDARFLGSPIDFVVFDGLMQGEVKQIVLIEVKTGKSALSSRERLVRDVVNAQKIIWRELRI